ncbi:MAG: hypothetical protein GEV07_29660 [Streptosporangiales bacterium]|nr:hypothetical protein [Streptosporangiales bacterium]
MDARPAARVAEPTTKCRQIGRWGTLARVVVGGVLLGTALDGPHVVDGVDPWAWPFALVVFPAALVGAQWLRSRRRTAPVRATGPMAHVLNITVFAALYGTTWYAPSVAVLSDTAVVFYGVSMVLAAVRGYAGCEVLAVSNWLLRRDDQVGCLLFWPVDAAEARRRR